MGLSLNLTNAVFTQVVTNANKFPRFATLTNMTESGNATSGYTYTEQSPGSFADGANLSLPAGVDGWMQYTLSAWTAGQNSLIGGFELAAGGSWYGDLMFSLYPNSSGTGWSLIEFGTGSGAINGTALVPANGDIVRIERIGTAVYAKVSSDGGTTFQTVHTFGTANAETLDLLPALSAHSGLPNGGAMFDTITMSPSAV